MFSKVVHNSLRTRPRIILFLNDFACALLSLAVSKQALQGCMQRVLETLVLADQLEFLRENGINADLVPVFDVDISPRAFAIIVRRRT